MISYFGKAQELKFWLDLKRNSRIIKIFARMGYFNYDVRGVISWFIK
ncbi:hypothetical protein FBZ99_11966 [Rhizobium sp. ERR 1071]|nr:hypothetical protein FBZ99_11966 [Rhizobium sp. ERR1071]